MNKYIHYIIHLEVLTVFMFSYVEDLKSKSRMMSLGKSQTGYIPYRHKIRPVHLMLGTKVKPGFTLCMTTHENAVQLS